MLRLVRSQLTATASRQVSTTAPLGANRHKYANRPKFERRKWLETEDWERRTHDGTEQVWHPNVPQDWHPEEWSRGHAYFGRYDFISILGNDVTLQPVVMAKGRPEERESSELKRLLKQRRAYGHRMFVEDLDAVNKRIAFLHKRDNYKKITESGCQPDFKVHGIWETKKSWRTQ